MRNGASRVGTSRKLTASQNETPFRDEAIVVTVETNLTPCFLLKPSSGPSVIRSRSSAPAFGGLSCHFSDACFRFCCCCHHMLRIRHIIHDSSIFVCICVDNVPAHFLLANGCLFSWFANWKNVSFFSPDSFDFIVTRAPVKRLTTWDGRMCFVRQIAFPSMHVPFQSSFFPNSSHVWRSKRELEIFLTVHLRFYLLELYTKRNELYLVTNKTPWTWTRRVQLHLTAVHAKSLGEIASQPSRW